MYMVKRSFWNAALFLSRRRYDGPKLIFKIFIYIVPDNFKISGSSESSNLNFKTPRKKTVHFSLYFVWKQLDRLRNIDDLKIVFRWITKKVGDFFSLFFFYYGWLPWQVRLFLSLFYTLLCLPEVGVLGRRRFRVDLWTFTFRRWKNALVKFYAKRYEGFSVILAQ